MNHILDIKYKGRELHITAKARQVGDDIVYDCYADHEFLGIVQPIVADVPIAMWVGEGLEQELVELIRAEIQRQDR